MGGDQGVRGDVCSLRCELVPAMHSARSRQITFLLDDLRFTIYCGAYRIRVPTPNAADDLQIYWS